MNGHARERLLARIESLPVDRRGFLKTGGVAGVAAWQLLISRAATAQECTASAAKLVEGKDDGLLVLEEKPIIFETPLELLDKQRITSKQFLFVRNNQDAPGGNTVKPLSPAGWKIEFTGLVDQPRTITVEELARFDQVEHEMVLQCSGNSRSLFSQAAKTSGTQWGRGGMGNVRFAGVPLMAVIKKHNVGIGLDVKFVAAEGKDAPEPGKEDFEHSLPLDDVLNKSILALKLNGEPIPAIHGGPVRLITPGYFGTMQIKWLTRLRFEKSETPNYNQIPRYRNPVRPIKPGDQFDPTFENSAPNWRMNVKSVVLSPLPGTKVPPGNLTVRGVAFNDGEARIESVLVSCDKGRTWQQAAFERPDSPYAWSRWETTVTVQPDTGQIWARAIDALGRTQPLDGSIRWNPQGYEWNGVEKIAVAVIGSAP